MNIVKNQAECNQQQSGYQGQFQVALAHNKYQELKVNLECIFKKSNPLVSMLTHSFTYRTLPLPIELVSQMLSQAIEGSHVLILKCTNPSTEWRRALQNVLEVTPFPFKNPLTNVSINYYISLG